MFTLSGMVGFVGKVGSHLLSRLRFLTLDCLIGVIYGALVH
jgi:hypothetical protein